MTGALVSGSRASGISRAGRVDRIMSEARHAPRLWYTRRDGVVRGPYPETLISGYILLGRIRDCDELRPGDGEWAALSQYPGLVPDVMKHAPTEAHLRELARIRALADERGPADRRKSGKHRAVARERRTGAERRHREPEYTPEYFQVEHRKPADTERYRYTLELGLLVMLCLALTYLLGPGGPGPNRRECGVDAVPGVNWDGCNLEGLVSRRANLVSAHIRNASLDAADLRDAVLIGADLRWSSLRFGSFRGADMSHASLIGVTARGADMRDARLNYANLAHADLSDTQLDGADLSGADLSHAIWFDRKPCMAGSIGACRRANPDLDRAATATLPAAPVSVGRVDRSHYAPLR
jgi:hypothetical protein